MAHPRIPALFSPIMKSRLSLTGWRLPLGIVDKPFSLGALFCILPFLQFSCIDNSAEMNFFIEASLIGPWGFGVCPRGFLFDPYPLTEIPFFGMCACSLAVSVNPKQGGIPWRTTSKCAYSAPNKTQIFTNPPVIPVRIEKVLPFQAYFELY